ncbi:Pentatricopeptide repeat-containing protein [Camellia lanceoleosa]|uniref:Pentatricopeptide repeat-containing protein n=1 Tax=Camellia lanceoleosa TaxID=1840588 RepID=A0ACC0FH00_9ERIC|nr:Pentatricopeptide repeat-containing protein [Camellia lanceoleosa]
MPVSASMIFRLMLEKESLPPANILGLVFMHMVKTQVGAYLALNILIELCDRFQHSSANRFASTKLIKPDMMIFNLVLDACMNGQRDELKKFKGNIDQVSVSLVHHYRLMLEKESLPPTNILGLVFIHMVKTQVGAYLALNILIELCDRFQHSSANRSASTKLIKPDMVIFNLVLDACVRFGSSFNGQ